jgi:hypothetical protein
MLEPMRPDQRRANERTSSLVDGRIASKGEWHNCRIVDVSVGGARLWLEYVLPETNEALLEIGHFGQFRTHLAWQQGKNVGVRFAHEPAEMAELVMALATYA